MAVTRPAVADAFDTRTTRLSSEDQVTWRLRPRVLPSANTPTAVSRRASPPVSVGRAGVRVLATRGDGLTVTVVARVTPPTVALIVAEPVPTAETTPAL